MEKETYDLLERHNHSEIPPATILENVKVHYSEFAESPEAHLRWLIEDTKDIPKYNNMYVTALNILLAEPKGE